MAVRQKDYNPANGLALLKLALQEKDANENTPGRVPSGIAQNAYFSSMPNTNEQEREAKSYDALDAGASERYQAGLDQNKEIDLANSGAHAMGFDNPRAQAEDAAMKKLQLVLAPEKMRLDAASAGADEARTFREMEGEKDRSLRRDLVNAQQGGQNQRQATTIGQQNAVAQAKYKQQHPILNFFGVGKPAPIAAPAGGAMDTSATVEMLTPDGRTMDVPQEKVAEMESHGAVRK